jgi:tricorn protease
MTKKICKILLSSLLVLMQLNLMAIEDARMLRFPDINNNLIAFVYAGDIWTVNSNGGEARRLTSHLGLELFPKISPDGKWIAFSGEYSGSRQVFVIPSSGGNPRQLTWYNSVDGMPPRGGFDDVVLGWTFDSKQILIRANRTAYGERNGRYFLVSLDGGLEKPLPIVNGGFAALSPDNSKIVFTPVDREFRNWKRYKGGRATDLWIYDLKNNTSEQITDWEGTDQLPVWTGDNIYFSSDRDLKLNIWKYDVQSKTTTQITHHSEFDVMWPSGQGDFIVYENGGYIYKLNLITGSTEKVTIRIDYDNPNLIPYYKNVSANINGAGVSPTGKRVLFDARGDIFSVPAEKGITENLTETQGIREINPAWSPDGKYIAYCSDKTGEYEIYLLENKKASLPKQLTFNSSAWINQPQWSPNSKYLVFSDRTLQLKLLEISSGKVSVIDHATASEIKSYNFSPDSRWIFYSKEGSNKKTALWVFDFVARKNIQVTDGNYSDRDAFFSNDGNYVFFVSDRDYNITFSSFEFDYLFNKATRLYAIALTSKSPKLFKEKNEEEPVKAESKVDSSNVITKNKKNIVNDNQKESVKNDKKVEIDFTGINTRIIALPGEAGEYNMIGVADEGPVFMTGGKLMRYNVKDEKSEEIIDKVQWAQLSADGKKALYHSGNDYGLIALTPGQKTGDGKLDLNGLEMKIDPLKEWNQIYNDVWRIFRDFFYVNNMHGVDWAKMRERYNVLIPYVGHRADLDYILSELIAEPNVGHAYIEWGDFEKPKRIEGGLLGAEITTDDAKGRYLISKIYNGENWNKKLRSPLTEQGVDVKEGDYIITINGKEVKASDNLYEFLENQASKQVEITVSSLAPGSVTRKSTIVPISSELNIRQLNWVNERRNMVDRLSGGRIGYIYVPNTGIEGNQELFHGMYSYFDKDALIIDDRNNGGGFIPDRMAELLNRRTLAYWHKNRLQPDKSPEIANDGPKVMLINGYSASGGDGFPYFFKKLGLGKLIGTRTWGGLVGIAGNASLVDGDHLSVPQFGIYDESGWVIEGTGISPDIEVVERPEQLAKGIDPCIEKAVEVLLKELKENPTKKVIEPAPPDRSGWRED